MVARLTKHIFFSYHIQYMRMGISLQEPWREDLHTTSKYSMYSGHWHYMSLMISFLWETARHSLPVVSSSKERLCSDLVYLFKNIILPCDLHMLPITWVILVRILYISALLEELKRNHYFWITCWGLFRYNEYNFSVELLEPHNLPWCVDLALGDLLFRLLKKLPHEEVFH
jgi:hypothetical protein